VEKIYTVLQSTLVLCLFLGILLLGKPTHPEKVPAHQRVAFEPERNWERIDFRAPLSRTFVFSILGLNQLPLFQEEEASQTDRIHHSVSYSPGVTSEKRSL
jgi:hypothetical protein